MFVVGIPDRMNISYIVGRRHLLVLVHRQTYLYLSLPVTHTSVLEQCSWRRDYVCDLISCIEKKRIEFVMWIFYTIFYVFQNDCIIFFRHGRSRLLTRIVQYFSLWTGNLIICVNVLNRYNSTEFSFNWKLI